MSSPILHPQAGVATSYDGPSQQQMPAAAWRHPTELKVKFPARSAAFTNTAPIPTFPILSLAALREAEALLRQPKYPGDMMPRLLELNYTHVTLSMTDEENDTHRLSQRMKQIAFGKNTPGYQVYADIISRGDRQFGNPNHPVTPRLNFKCPKRSWDNLVGQWRRALHLWDERPAPQEMTVEGLPTLSEMGLEDPESRQHEQQRAADTIRLLNLRSGALGLDGEEEDEDDELDEEGLNQEQLNHDYTSAHPTPSKGDGSGAAAMDRSPLHFTFIPRASPAPKIGQYASYGGCHITPNRFFNNTLTPQHYNSASSIGPTGQTTGGATLPPGQSPCGVSALREDSVVVPPGPRQLVFQDLM